MPEFCDVALPLPLEATFTYRLSEESPQPCIGGRVIVPFRDRRFCGIVTEIHHRAPEFETRRLAQVLDTTPALTPELMRLGRWIAQYYIAPIGEVFRSMLPLSAEFRRVTGYRITEKGIDALQLASEVGSSLRSRQEPAHQMLEYAVLNRLADGEVVREATLRSSSDASRDVLRTLLSKKWIAREDLSDLRHAARTVQIVTLGKVEGKLNANQQTLVDYLKSQEGQRAPIESLRELPVPRTTVQTLARRGVVKLSEEPAGFQLSGMKPRKLEFLFTPAQKTALEAITSAATKPQFQPMLLHGVTGSGKTAVYLSAMQAVLAAGRSAILLVPEIGLTPAMAADLHQVFGDEVAILHSGLSDDERAEQWKRIRNGECHIVVGTRSAIFAPVTNLALIVVDEEHDHSYKQEEMPRYHARDVAVMRAKMSDSAVVLGSATPSLETYHNAVQGKYRLLELPERIEKRPLPEVEILDMRQEFQRTRSDEPLSRKLVEQICDRLQRNEQVMVLLNRRGYSTFVLCRQCGDSVQCKNCAIAMTYHKRQHRLVCHYCGFTKSAPKTCPKCGSEYVQYLGTGSEKLEYILHGMFPQARIARLDRDTVRGRDAFERMLSALQAGEIDLLVGTQMIAKGHDVANVTLVGVVGSDAALSFPDFRAAERTFQLLTQVAGRAGRGETPGKVILQTFFPDHYAIQYAAAHDYRGFYEKEMRFRSWMHYPPFNAVSNVVVRSDKLEEALTWSGILGKWFEAARVEGLRVMGPAAAAIVKLKTEYRYHFLLKSKSRERMNAALRSMLEHAAAQRIPRTNIVVDVDALSFI
jgi:primosomal protein N' (replication factor Y)